LVLYLLRLANETRSESNVMDASHHNRADGEPAALRAAARLVAEGASPRVVLETAARHVADAVGADFVEILRLDRRDHTAVFAAWSARNAKIIDLDHWLLDDDHLAQEVMRTQKPVRRDLPHDARDGDSTGRGLGITSSVGVAISLAGKVWGAMLVHSVGASLPSDTAERLSSFDALIGSALTNSRIQADMEQLIAEQAALLRVAELVARESEASDVFHAVAEQLGRVTHVSGAQVLRFDDGEMATSVGNWGPVDSGIRVGTRLSTRGNSVTGQVRATGLPARVEDYSSVEGQLGALQRGVGMRSAVGAPIRAGGRLWGVLVVGSVAEEPLPAETEERMAKFADLVGVALSNLDARNSQEVLADEQEALRRVATVVAREEWDVTFPTIVRELALILRAQGSVIIRYENDQLATVVAAWGEPEELVSYVGKTQNFRGDNPGDFVYRTHRPARQVFFEGAVGEYAQNALRMGLTESLAGPVFVENRLWGAIVVVTTGPGMMPPETEGRIGQFAELVATAIGNMKSRLELIESRARIVQTADQTRRRFERDLHDGIQQRLVSISMDLRTVEHQLPADDESRSRVSLIADDLVAALDGLRELSRGIHPAILSEGGLVPAARSLARRSTIPVTLNLPQPARHPDSVEVAAYYVMSEALANTAKYARASTAHISITPSGDELIVIVTDDGIGGADVTKGSGLIGLEDRVEAVGGSFTVQSPPMGGTTITARLPLIFV
jgi:signal transduction histidine kinase